MSERCPLDSLDVLERNHVLWDGASGTELCIERCVVASLAGSLVVSETHDLPDDFDPERDDSSNHYGVQWLRSRHRAGFQDYGPDDPNDMIIIEESTSVFICPFTEQNR